MKKLTHSAAFLIFLSGVIWSFTGLFSRFVTWGPFTLVGVRAVVATVILGLARKSFRVRINRGLVLSGLSIMATSLLFMAAIRKTSAANAIVLQYTAPVFVIAYMFFIKKQRPLRSELIAAVCVMGGVCLCFAGGLRGGALAGDLIALLSGVTYAVVYLSARYSGNDPRDNVYFGTLISCVFIVFAPFDSNFNLTPSSLLVGVLMGMGLGFGYLFFALGIRRGISAVAATIINNVEPVLNPLWVFLIVGENPGVLAVVGAAVVLLAVTVQSLYEARRHRADISAQG